METLNIVDNGNGKTWNVRIVPAGTPHGRTGKLVSGKDLVEFYDATYTNMGGLGQFVCSYHTGQVFDREDGPGMLLHGASPNWVITGQTVNKVCAWMASKGF